MSRPRKNGEQRKKEQDKGANLESSGIVSFHGQEAAKHLNSGKVLDDGESKRI